MITSYLPSKLVRHTGLLVASALLAFSTTAATAATLPYATELTEIQDALNATSGTTAGLITVSNATAAQLHAALVWSGTAKSTTAKPSPVKLAAANAYLFAEAIESGANPNLTPAATLTELVGDVKVGSVNTPVATVGAIANGLLSGTAGSRLLNDAQALAVIKAGLASPIFVTGTTKALTPEVLRADYIKAVWAATTPTWWINGTATKGSYEALAQITNAVILSDSTALGKETLAVDAITLAPKAAESIINVVTTGTALGITTGSFVEYVISKSPTNGGAILIGAVEANPASASSIATLAFQGSITSAPAISASLATIVPLGSEDAIVVSLINAYTAYNATAKVKVAFNPADVEGIAKAIPLAATTLTGSAAGEALANETAAVLYTSGTYATAGKTGAALNSALTSLLGDLLGAAGARIPHVTGPSATQAAEITAYYQYLAADLYKVAITGIGSSLTTAQKTALANVIKSDLDASIAASMSGVGTTGLTGYVAVAKAAVLAADSATPPAGVVPAPGPYQVTIVLP